MLIIYVDTHIRTCIHIAVIIHTCNIACNFKTDARILWTFVAQTHTLRYTCIRICAELLNTHKLLTLMNGDVYSTCCKVLLSMNT